MFSSNTTGYGEEIRLQLRELFPSLSLSPVNLSANSDFRSIRYEKIINYCNHSQVIFTKDIDNNTYFCSVFKACIRKLSCAPTALLFSLALCVWPTQPKIRELNWREKVMGLGLLSFIVFDGSLLWLIRFFLWSQS